MRRGFHSHTFLRFTRTDSPINSPFDAFTNAQSHASTTHRLTHQNPFRRLQTHTQINARYLLFPEDRRNALRLTNSPDLPVKWGQSGPSNLFDATARRGEWYPFQVGVWAINATSGLNITSATYSHELAADAWTCINLGGVDETGASFTKSVSITSGHVNSLWFGVQVRVNFPQSFFVFASFCRDDRRTWVCQHVLPNSKGCCSQHLRQILLSDL